MKSRVTSFLLDDHHPRCTTPQNDSRKKKNFPPFPKILKFHTVSANVLGDIIQGWVILATGTPLISGKRSLINVQRRACHGHSRLLL